MTDPKLQVFDSRAMPWEDRFIPELGKSLFAKRFLEDRETGVTARLVKYPAGLTNTWHAHRVATACMSWKELWSPMTAPLGRTPLSGFRRA